MVPVHVNSLGFRQAGAQSIDCEETWKPLVTVAVAKKRTQQCSLLGCRSVCHAAFSSARDGSQFAYMPASKMRIPTAALRHNSVNPDGTMDACSENSNKEIEDLPRSTGGSTSSGRQRHGSSSRARRHATHLQPSCLAAWWLVIFGWSSATAG